MLVPRVILVFKVGSDKGYSIDPSYGGIVVTNIMSNNKVQLGSPWLSAFNTLVNFNFQTSLKTAALCA